MNGEKILIILAVIMFAIGALLPAISPGGSPRSVNWLCAGLCFATAAWFVTMH